jgi:hypothetical protein
MKSIKTDNIKEGLKNFVESFRDQNDDVTRYASEKVVDKVVKDRGYSGTKISERRITSNGVR